MRKNTFVRDTIIVLVCVAMAAYVLVGFGAAPPTSPENTITTIGDTKVKRRDVDMLRMRGTRSMGMQDTNQLLAGELLRNSILLDGARDAGIVVSDGQLRDVVIANRRYGDQYLSDEEWENFVWSNFRVQVGTLENYYREHWLRVNKFQTLFFEGVYVPQKEVEERFLEENSKVELEMMVLNTTDIQNQVALENDEQVRDFYQKNQDKFMTGPQRIIQFVSFPINEYLEQVKPSEEELLAYYNQNMERYRQQEQVKASHVLIKTETRSEEEALAEITRIKKEIEDGLPFADAAVKYSEDLTNNERGGDLGFFARGRMVPPFENMAFTLEVGQISEPVKTDFGYHLINKVDYQEERLRPFEEVKAGIESTVNRSKAREYASGLAEAFYLATSNDVPFHEAAESSGYPVHVSPAFDEDSASDLGEILGKNFQVRRAVFTLEELNDLTPVTNAGTHMVVAQWVAEEDPRPLDADQELDRIKAMASKIAGRSFIEDLFAEIREKAQADPEKAFKDLAGERDFLRDNFFKDSGMFTETTIPYEVRRDDLSFADDIYALETGAFLDSIETATDTRFVLARVKNKQEPDLELLEAERPRIVNELSSRRGSEAYAAYLYHKIEKTDPDGIKQARINMAFEIR